MMVLRCVLTVEPSITASEIVKLAFQTLHELKLELPDSEYCLLYSNKKLADKVPLTDEPFTLEAYKAFIGKPYQQLTLYIREEVIIRESFVNQMDFKPKMKQ